MGPQRSRQVQFIHCDRLGRREQRGQLGRAVDGPTATDRIDCFVPLAKPCLFAQMDLLPLSDQPDHHGPTVHSGAEPEEVLRLGGAVTPFGAHAVGVPGSLRLVIDPDMLFWLPVAAASVCLEEPVHVLDEHAAPKRVLQNLHERSIAG